MKPETQAQIDCARVAFETIIRPLEKNEEEWIEAVYELIDQLEISLRAFRETHTKRRELDDDD